MVLTLQELIEFRDEIIEVAEQKGIKKEEIKTILAIALNKKFEEVDYIKIVDAIITAAEQKGMNQTTIITILAEATQNREKKINIIKPKPGKDIEIYASPRFRDIEPEIYASPRFKDIEPAIYASPRFFDYDEKKFIDLSDLSDLTKDAQTKKRK